tara:strand:- start:29 stop:892 length:864 start_codon:yes stop_codon:yes gene_type:complete
MLKIFLKTVYFILIILDKFIKIFAKRFEFLLFLKEYIEINSYKEISIKNNKKIKFFVPNKSVDLRIKRFFTKEPGTLKWIDDFDLSDNSTFWDIGANIGIFSLYAAKIHEKIKVVAFEPSTSNLRTLSRNISINNFQHKILINQLAINDKESIFQTFNERRFQEGSSFNFFDEEKMANLKSNSFENKYSIFGTTLDFFLKNTVLEIPNYIKIDVDGNEDLVLSSIKDHLKNPTIKSIILELDEKDEAKKKYIIETLNNASFKIISVDKSLDNKKTKYHSMRNYIFNR